MLKRWWMSYFSKGEREVLRDIGALVAIAVMSVIAAAVYLHASHQSIPIP